MKKVLVMFLTVLMLSVCTVPGLAVTEIDSSTVNRYNVMLVIDGSGSLTQTSTPTDPTGLRYDALKLFLGLLTDQGNYVGAIVFNQDLMLDTGLKEMNGQADKLSLAQDIEAAGVGGDTDIGGAMLRAAQILEGKTEENGLQSVILLLSDGNTDLPRASAAELEKSYADEDRAIELAQQENIRIYGIWLNASGSGKAEEMQRMADSTNGYYEEVRSAGDLTAAFARFYTMINNTPEVPAGPTRFGPDGKIDLTFSVPSVGVEEVNIIVRSDSPLTAMKLTRPDATEIGGSEIERMTISTRQYQMIKISEPMEGMWLLRLEGVPESAVNISMLCNTTLQALLSIQKKADVYQEASTQIFDCVLQDSRDGRISSADYQKFQAELVLINANTQEETRTPMIPHSASFTADVTLGGKGTYYAYALISSEGFSISTERIKLPVGNLPPTALSHSISETVKTGLLHSGRWSVDMNTLFTDPEGQPLTFSLLHNNYDEETVRLEDGTLTVDCSGADYVNLTLVAADPDNATASMEVRLSAKSMTQTILLVLAAVIVIAIITVLLVRKTIRGRVYKGAIQVSGFNYVTGDWSTPMTRTGFQHRLPLSAFNIGDCGIGPDCCFEATKDPNVCLFKSPKPVLASNSGSAMRTTVEVRLNTSIYIYTDEKQERGIQISTSNPY